MIGDTVQVEYNNQVCVGTVVDENGNRVYVQFSCIGNDGIPESLLMWFDKSNLL